MARVALTSTVVLLILGAFGNAKPQTSTPPIDAVYVVAYRAPNHIKLSRPEIFHGFANDLTSYLKSRDVHILEDPERGMLQIDQLMSVESLLNLTKNAGAKYLLLATVERPVTKWMKVTVQAYDLSGMLLWSEEATSGGGVTGKGASEKILKSLQKKLDSRIDKPGLPRISRETVTAPVKGEPANP